MDRKLGINSNCIRGMKELDVLPLIKEAGFVSFFTQAYTVSEVTALKEQADSSGCSTRAFTPPSEASIPFGFRAWIICPSTVA